jgi:hypothetical protein
MRARRLKSVYHIYYSKKDRGALFRSLNIRSQINYRRLPLPFTEFEMALSKYSIIFAYPIIESSLVELNLGTCSSNPISH